MLEKWAEVQKDTTVEWTSVKLSRENSEQLQYLFDKNSNMTRSGLVNDVFDIGLHVIFETMAEVKAEQVLTSIQK